MFNPTIIGTIAEDSLFLHNVDGDDTQRPHSVITFNLIASYHTLESDINTDMFSIFDCMYVVPQDEDATALYGGLNKPNTTVMVSGNISATNSISVTFINTIDPALEPRIITTAICQGTASTPPHIDIDPVTHNRVISLVIEDDLETKLIARTYLDASDESIDPGDITLHIISAYAESQQYGYELYGYLNSGDLLIKQPDGSFIESEYDSRATKDNLTAPFELIVDYQQLLN